jgi:hypothetical protein
VDFGDYTELVGCAWTAVDPLLRVPGRAQCSTDAWPGRTLYPVTRVLSVRTNASAAREGARASSTGRLIPRLHGSNRTKTRFSARIHP